MSIGMIFFWLAISGTCFYLSWQCWQFHRGQDPFRPLSDDPDDGWRIPLDKREGE